MNTPEQLLAAQASLAGLIERSISNFEKLGKEKQTPSTIKSRLNSMKDYWSKFQLHNAQLEAMLNPEDEHRKDVYYTNDVFFRTSEFFDIACDYYENLSSKFTRPIWEFQSESLDRSVLPEERVALRLPSINLPKFSGDFRDWENYRDMFNALVDTNHNLNDVQKLHYLKTSLTSEAALVLKHTSITEKNYKPAWELLKKRYNNTRVIVNSYLKLLFDIPIVNEKTNLSDLKTLRNQANDIRAALLNLNRPVDKWEDLFIFSLVKKLDATSLAEWETKLGATTDMPTFLQFDEFCDTRIRILDSISTQENKSSCESRIKLDNSSYVRENKRIFKVNQVTSDTKNCFRCNGKHPLYFCHAFKKDSVPSRRELIRKNQLCFNCLKKGHITAQCNSTYSCNVCKRKHHTLLHFEGSVSNVFSAPTDEPARISSEVSGNFISDSRFTCNMLPTAIVKLCADNGRSIVVRALLDQGSQVSCVTERVVQALKLKIHRVSIELKGIGVNSGESIEKSVSFTIMPRNSNQPNLPIQALVLPVLTSYCPSKLVWNPAWSYLENLNLADPHPLDGQPIDLLLGAGEFSQIILGGLKKGTKDEPIAQQTVFGWIISGVGSKPLTMHITVNSATVWPSVDETIQRFWELEEVPSAPKHTALEIECEQHFVSTHRRQEDGRYVVSLPFNTPRPIPIGETYHIAQRIFLQNEKRMKNNSKLYDKYKQFMQEYIDLGHMKKSSIIPVNPDGIFIPHLPVLREESKTTKLRVVFNASVKSSNGSTLNDFLHIGPKLQIDLSALILKWRLFEFVYAADLEKMFRQILVEPNDTCYQQVLWRNDSTEELSVYQLLTVTYGTTCAPYLANRVLRQLALDEGNKFPNAAPLLRENFYVDDVLFGANDLKSLRKLRIELQTLLKAGGFHLRKWASNHPELLQDIPIENHGLALGKTFSLDEKLKVLGIAWNPTTDEFAFSLHPPLQVVLTKRTFLSTLASIFDPLGWIAPFLVSGKILIQFLWIRRLDWDEPLPADLSLKCTQFFEQIPEIKHLRVSRWMGTRDSEGEVELHGFGDASNLAYSASIYLRVQTPDGLVKTSLLCAKTKVAPLKTQSIPRLELCAATLLSKLMLFVCETLQLRDPTIHCWSDSQTVLHWLNMSPTKLKGFVANRVSLIQTSLPKVKWNFVPGSDNPADCASRGVTVIALRNHHLWWHGPAWLLQSPSHWPKLKLEKSPESEQEIKTVHANTAVNPENEWDLLERFSDWNKLLRVASYMLRFIECCRDPSSCPTDVSLKPEELISAENCLIRYTQRQIYSSEIKCLMKKESLPNKSSILPLTPYLDSSKVLRVGGRLKHSLLSEPQKFPPILPKGRLAEMIIRDCHLRTKHGGIQVTLRVLRESYWVVSARSLARQIIHKCVVCTRFRGNVQSQLMGDLPSIRLQPARPFEHVGIDFAGPLLVRLGSGRGIKVRKCYITLFVCLCVRAIHIEVVTDYTTASFLAAFDRFSARRGLPHKVYSDNGTTFQGASRELARNFQAVISDDSLKHRMLQDRVSWEFIPPNAPHFGGIWEAGIKSTKHHLKRVLGNYTPTLEEMQTLLCGIEAILNSRPLTPLNDDPDNFDALTPGHFLVGSLLAVPPVPSLLDRNPNYLSRWQTMRTMMESFWRVWSVDYLNQLQQKTKWRLVRENLKENDIVLIKDKNLPPAKWSLARVLCCHPGEDGLVRVVTLRTACSQFDRSIAQLCKLPV